MNGGYFWTGRARSSRVGGGIDKFGGVGTFSLLSVRFFNGHVGSVHDLGILDQNGERMPDYWKNMLDTWVNVDMFN